MFTSKSKTTDTPVGSTTIIGAGTVIHGDIESNGDIRIDGTLIGNLSSQSKVLIGQDGVVEGDINGQQADIMGKVTGMIKIKELLQLRGKSLVSGEIYTGKLEVEPTATFNGSCHMGANVVGLTAELGNVANK
ncbi:MAG: polymer-forming cytoskeletal protein [Chitinophagaceae bacterium]|nr:polymer-forming cytoskeletal protein [Chitinophagaceae bacterium]